MALAQQLGHIVIGGAGMDDQRQPGFLGGANMHIQRGFLHLGAVGSVMIIKPGFPNAHEFGVL